MNECWLESGVGPWRRAACETGWRGRWRNRSEAAYRDLQRHLVQCRGVDYCGCCGNQIDATEGAWCLRCAQHVGRFDGYEWDRTYFAINGVDCPFQVAARPL